MYNVTLNGETRVANSQEEAMAIAGDLAAKYGAVPKIVPIAKQNSSTQHGLVHDAEAEKRINAQHVALNAVAEVDSSQQAYATGTRMAASGYATQRTREQEFKAKLSIKEVAATLSDIVRAEKRREIEMLSGELANKIAITPSGAITLDGYRLTEQAIRGLCPRIESRSIAYLIGMRDRMMGGQSNKDLDREMIAHVLRHELNAAPSVELKLRVRDGIGDCFAVVSPTYSPADAPETLAQITHDLPQDARGTFSYDPTSTSWQVRANVFTPTPVDEQAVGEVFEGYSAFGGKDAGNGGLYFRGGALFLRCLNASTYAAESAISRRIHKGRVLLDVGMLFENASKAIHTLCQLWGTARTVELPEAPTIEGIKLAREIALAGYFRGMFSDKRSELQGVLVGRTEHHVEQLVNVYDSERRDTKKLVKSDLAQAMTRYAQGFNADVQRSVESGAGQWLASNRLPVCDARPE